MAVCDEQVVLAPSTYTLKRWIVDSLNTSTLAKQSVLEGGTYIDFCKGDFLSCTYPRIGST